MIPQVDCKGLCFEACSGIVACTRTEMARMLEHAEATRFALRPGQERRCQFLTDSNRCAVYPVRPLICRTYAATPAQPCAHGCKAKHPLPESRAVELTGDVFAIDGGKRYLEPGDVLAVTDGTERTAAQIVDMIHGARSDG